MRTQTANSYLKITISSLPPSEMFFLTNVHSASTDTPADVYILKTTDTPTVVRI